MQHVPATPADQTNQLDRMRQKIAAQVCVPSAIQHPFPLMITMYEQHQVQQQQQPTTGITMHACAQKQPTSSTTARPPAPASTCAARPQPATPAGAICHADRPTDIVVKSDYHYYVHVRCCTLASTGNSNINNNDRPDSRPSDHRRQVQHHRGRTGQGPMYIIIVRTSMPSMYACTPTTRRQWRREIDICNKLFNDNGRPTRCRCLPGQPSK